MPRRTISAAENVRKHFGDAGDLQDAKRDQGHQEEDDQKRAYLATREQKCAKARAERKTRGTKGPFRPTIQSLSRAQCVRTARIPVKLLRHYSIGTGRSSVGG